MNFNAFQRFVLGILFFLGIGLMLWDVEARQSPQTLSNHQHRISDLRLYAVKVIDVSRGRIVYNDLEEDASESMVVRVHQVDVDSDFRLLEIKESSSQDGSIRLLGLGALKGSTGILTICQVCNKAVGMRTGVINFYK